MAWHCDAMRCIALHCDANNDALRCDAECVAECLFSPMRSKAFLTGAPSRVPDESVNCKGALIRIAGITASRYLPPRPANHLRATSPIKRALQRGSSVRCHQVAIARIVVLQSPPLGGWRTLHPVSSSFCSAASSFGIRSLQLCN